MSRMTCRPRLRQRLRRGENGFIFVAAICLALMVTSARGGTLDAPAAPTNAISAMFTLNDIYNVLDTRTTNVAKRAGAFTEPTGGPTNGTMHTLSDIMTLATNRAPVPKTWQTTSYTTNDDGWYGTNVGVAWPTQRFTVVGASGTEATNQIRDNLTGLIWARNANLATNAAFNPAWSSTAGTCTWYQAFDVITNSNGPVNGTAKYGGTNDWRLPNVQEMQSLINYQFRDPALSDGTGTNKWTETLGPFTGVRLKSYWSSTTFAGDTNNAWPEELIDGRSTVWDNKTNAINYVWPVRGGQ